MNSVAPDKRLALDASLPGLSVYERDFFRRDTEVVARSLIGAWILRRYRGQWYGGRIVETEAYLGESDRAAHSWGGRRTPRVEPMYMDGGHLYVFLVYGMHHCANVVTRSEGIPHAVLLRAAEGPAGCPAKLLAGPGKLCAGLGITVKSSGLDLLGGGSIRVMRAEAPVPRVGVTARIGIDYAGEARDWPLRFVDLDSASLSGTRNSPRRG
jgi:DNA-3-methyladenine glycosylase